MKVKELHETKVNGENWQREVTLYPWLQIFLMKQHIFSRPHHFDAAHCCSR